MLWLLIKMKEEICEYLKSSRNLHCSEILMKAIEVFNYYKTQVMKELMFLQKINFTNLVIY